MVRRQEKQNTTWQSANGVIYEDEKGLEWFSSEISQSSSLVPTYEHSHFPRRWNFPTSSHPAGPFPILKLTLREGLSKPHSE